LPVVYVIVLYAVSAMKPSTPRLLFVGAALLLDNVPDTVEDPMLVSYGTYDSADQYGVTVPAPVMVEVN